MISHFKEAKLIDEDLILVKFSNGIDSTFTPVELVSLMRYREVPEINVPILIKQ